MKSAERQVTVKQYPAPRQRMNGTHLENPLPGRQVVVIRCRPGTQQAGKRAGGVPPRTCRETAEINAGRTAGRRQANRQNLQCSAAETQAGKSRYGRRTAGGREGITKTKRTKRAAGSRGAGRYSRQAGGIWRW